MIGGVKGWFEMGVMVYWDFYDFFGVFLVKVVEVVKYRKIVFEWEVEDKVVIYDIWVIMIFEFFEDD